MRRIKHLLRQDPAVKVLVFSSWQDVLELVSHALQTNKLPYAYARGRKAFDKAIADFKQPSSAEGGKSAGIQILLMLVKQGANGLNLTGVCPCHPAVPSLPTYHHRSQYVCISSCCDISDCVIMCITPMH